MKIIKGSFGTSGTAKLSSNAIVIEGTEYHASQITKTTAEIVVEKRFGLGGFIIGAVMLAILGFLLLSIIGAAIGVIVAFLGSRYSKSIHLVTLEFDDNKTVTLQGSKSQIKAVASLTITK